MSWQSVSIAAAMLQAFKLSLSIRTEARSTEPNSKPMKVCQHRVHTLKGSNPRPWVSVLGGRA